MKLLKPVPITTPEGVACESHQQENAVSKGRALHSCLLLYKLAAMQQHYYCTALSPAPAPAPAPLPSIQTKPNEPNPNDNARGLRRIETMYNKNNQRWLARTPSYALPGDLARVVLQPLLLFRWCWRRWQPELLRLGRRRSTPVRGRTRSCRPRRRRRRRRNAGAWFGVFGPCCRCQSGFRHVEARARGQVGRGGCRGPAGAAVAAAAGGGRDRGWGLARGLRDP